MSISIRCPACGVSLRFDDSLAGRKARCSACREVMVVEEPEEDPEEEQELRPGRHVSFRKPAVDQPLIPTRRVRDDADEDEDERRKPRKPVPVWQREMVGGAIYFAVIGGFAIISICGGLGAFYFISRVGSVAPPMVAPTIQQDDPLDAFLADLRGIDPAKRVFAAQSLRGSEPNIPRRDEVARSLAACLKDMNPPSAEQAAETLEKWATPVVSQELLEGLRSPNEKISQSCLRALATARDPATYIEIAKRLTTARRNDARDALRQIGEPAQGVTLPYLTHADAQVRDAACQVLAQIGNRDALTALEAMRRDPDRRVQAVAGSAIRRIMERHP